MKTLIRVYIYQIKKVVTDILYATLLNILYVKYIPCLNNAGNLTKLFPLINNWATNLAHK